MNVDAMIKHHQAATEVITHAMSDYASAATGTSWNKACFAFEADAILCALSRAGFRILGPDEVDPVTVERCVEVAAATDPEKPANWLHRREEIAAAIRALSSPDHNADAGNLVEGDGWRDIASAPMDKTPVIIAVPTRDKDGFIVGEAYFDPEHYDGGDWWWANTCHAEYGDSPISEINYHGPARWRPLPAPPIQQFVINPVGEPHV